MTKILIVDDHLAFRKGLHLMLKELPEVIEISEMENGTQFINALDTISPDLVFLDIKMPGISGIEAASIALKKKPELRIIILTMFGEEKYLKEAIDVGVKGFTTKPPTLAQLKDAYMSVINNGVYFPSVEKNKNSKIR